jgi:hypothetical protein
LGTTVAIVEHALPPNGPSISEKKESKELFKGDPSLVAAGNQGSGSIVCLWWCPQAAKIIHHEFLIRVKDVKCGFGLQSLSPFK